jgi:hypothetical protein
MVELITTKLGHDGQSVGRNLNLRPSQYEAYILRLNIDVHCFGVMQFSVREKWKCIRDQML